MMPSLQVADALLAGSAQAVRRSAENLLSLQREEGFWWGELTADTTLESDYILLQLWLHPPRAGAWDPPNREQIHRAACSILDRQLPDGSFNIYPAGPGDVSATVKAYFALKLAGVPVEDPRMRQARERILEMGGIQASNSYVKINLSLFDLYPREYVPSIPPEIMFLPFNFLYQMSSWTRAIVVPLSIIHAANPRRPVPEGFDLKELYLPDAGMEFPREKFLSWRNFFLRVDKGLKVWEKYGPKSIRRKAIRRAEQWIVERTYHSDGLGAIYPPMMYLIMALDVLGYEKNHPDRVEAIRQFENLMVDDGSRFFFQPCFSPVWDTAIAAFVLAEAGNPSPEALRRAADWLVSKEVRRKGDWSVKRPDTEPSGWYFEFANEFYPDIDDTAMVLLALSRVRGNRSGEQEAAMRRGVQWLLDMQSKDGGWAAFDVDNDWEPLSYVPFADHNAILDPTCPDITGRVLEALCDCGVDPKSPSIRRGIEYLVRTQEQDGS